MNVLLVQVIGSIPEIKTVHSITMNNDVALNMFLHATRRFHALRDIYRDMGEFIDCTARLRLKDLRV